MFQPITILCVLILLGASCTRQQSPIYPKLEGTNTCRVGQQIVIALPADFGSGSIWKLADSCAGMSQSKPSDYSIRNTTETDTSRFYFKANKSGVCTLRFIYKQPFVKENLVKDSKTFHFTIK